VEDRDSRPDRPRNPDAGIARRQPVGVRNGVAAYRPFRDPRFAGRYPVSGRIAARPMPRTLPILPHGVTTQPGRFPSMPGVRAGFGLPSLRRNVCPHFYLTGRRGAIPIQAPHLLKALIRQEQNVSRCQLRGGVHLEGGYVNDVCLTPRFNQCVFYEDELTKG
jgi:hypothetical protein